MSQIHSTAIIESGAQIAKGCHIGPYCVIGANVMLGQGCTLHSHIVIDGHTQLGEANTIYPFASIGLQSQDLKHTGGTTHIRIGTHNTFREYVTIHSATDAGNATVIGSYNNFLAYTHVAHDCQLGDHIVMSNVATLGGHVTIEDRAIIGGLAAVHQFCRIGMMSIIGGCSKVVQDIPPYMLADGNPATIRALNKEGLKRNQVSKESQAALKQAHRILFRSELTISNAIESATQEVENTPEVTHLLTFLKCSQRGIAT